MKKNIILILKILFILTCFYLLMTKVDIISTVEYFKKINYLIFIPVFLYIPNMIISVYKWRISLPKNDKSFKYFLNIYWIGNFFSNFLPTTIGGDTYKTLKLKKDFPMSKILYSIFLDRGSGLLAVLFTTIIFSFQIYHKTQNFYLIILPSALLLSGILFLLFVKKINFKGTNKVSAFIVRIKNIWIETKFRFILKLFSISLFYVLLGGISLWIYYFIFGYNLNFFYVLAFYALIQVIGILPISINAIGITATLTVYLFTFLGVPPEVSLAVAVVARVVLFIQSSVGDIIYLSQKN